MNATCFIAILCQYLDNNHPLANPTHPMPLNYTLQPSPSITIPILNPISPRAIAPKSAQYLYNNIFTSFRDKKPLFAPSFNQNCLSHSFWRSEGGISMVYFIFYSSSFNNRPKLSKESCKEKKVEKNYVFSLDSSILCRF